MESLLRDEHYLSLVEPEIIRRLQGKLFEAVLKVILKD